MTDLEVKARELLRDHLDNSISLYGAQRLYRTNITCFLGEELISASSVYGLELLIALLKVGSDDMFLTEQRMVVEMQQRDSDVQLI